MRCWVSTPAVAQAPPGGQAEPSGIAVLDPAVRPGVPVNVPDAGPPRQVRRRGISKGGGRTLIPRSSQTYRLPNALEQGRHKPR
jgi:hypothetical protein